MDKVRALRIFRQVALDDGFAAAARSLGISRPSVSNAISQLEGDLGVELFARTTRMIHITDAGRRYLERVALVLEELDQAESDLKGDGGPPRGRLNVCAATAFGAEYVAPATASFLKKYPEVQVALRFTDDEVDPVTQQIDLALRIAPAMTEWTTPARAIAPLRRVLVASRSYLKRRGAVRELSDLRRHECLIHERDADGTLWRFLGPGARTVRVRGPLKTDSMMALRTAALNGVGVAAAPLYMVSADLIDQRLLRVLPSLELEPYSLFAVFPPGGRPSPKAALFLQHLIEGIGSPPHWERVAEPERPRLAG